MSRAGCPATVEAIREVDPFGIDGCPLCGESVLVHKTEQGTEPDYEHIEESRHKPPVGPEWEDTKGRTP